MLKEEQLNKLKGIRRILHANPELSGKEFETQKRILNFLKNESLAKLKIVGDTGILAIFESDQEGPSVMIRGDIDALPISEINTFTYRSTNEGVSHKCGHDGHTTVLLGLASLLSNQTIKKGRVLLLFQPAEENGTGAELVLSDEKFNKEKIDYVFAMHNLPGFPTHEIIVKEKEFTGNVKSLIIKIDGKTAHAAEPEKGHNPGMAISEILAYANTINNNKPEESDFFLMTPVYARMGEKAYGISAGHAELHFTIRSWSTDLMDQRSMEIVSFIGKTCKQYYLVPEFTWTEIFYANFNSPLAVEFIRKACQINDLKLAERKYPFKWGEDFGLFTQKYPGAMFGIGAGLSTPALHNPDYDYPDEITGTAILMFYEIINQIL